MKNMLNGLRLAACGLLLIASGEIWAAATITFSEVGSNVQATIAGTINTTGLTARNTPSNAGFVRGTDNFALIGTNVVTSTQLWSGVTGPQNFGTGSGFNADSGIGDPTGILFSFSYGLSLSLPTSYTSGAPVSASSTWNNTTIAGLGLTPGNYTYNWGSGANADSLTITIGSAPAPSAVPTLSEWSQMLLGLMVLTMIGWHFHRQRSF